MDYGEGSSLTGRLTNSNNFKIYVAIFVLWNILLFSLAVSGVALARKNSNNDSDSSSTTADPCIKTTVPLYSENKYYSNGMAVSLVSEDGGSVRVGGGTTIYKRQKISDAIASLTDFVIIDIDSTHVFLAFTTPNGTLAYSVGVISSDQVIWNEAFSSKVQAGHLASGAKLTPNLLVLGTDAGVIPITIQLPTVTIYEPATNRGASNNTQLCALDTNAIAVSFPLPPAGMVTTAAIVTYTPGTAPVVTWAENTEQYSVSILSAHTVACFEPEHYLLSYVDNTSIVSQGIFFAPSSNQITFTASSILPGVTAAQYIRSATLKDSLAVAGILYIDTTQNALLTTTVGLTADLIQYGTSLVINSGGVLGDVSQTKIAAIAPFGAENGFVVSYSDWANQDRVTILVGQIAESNTMEAASPAYVISNPNTDQYNHQYWSDIVKLSETTFVNAFALMNGTSADGIGSATGLVLTAPIGVIMEVQEDEAVVGVSGQCAVLGNIMNVGNYYYTDSLGILYARNPSDTPLYEYLDYGNLILSKNTLVGVGINSKDVLIKTTVY